MKRMVEANIKSQKHQMSVKNVILTSAKVVSSNIPVVNQKRNRLCDIFAVKVTFFSL